MAAGTEGITQPAYPYTSSPHLKCRFGEVAIQHEHWGSRQGLRHPGLTQQRRQQRLLQQADVRHTGCHLSS